MSATTLFAAALLSTGGVLQQTHAITTSLRPEQVRAGGRVVLTVRVEYAGDPPDLIDLVEASEVDVADVLDRHVAASGMPGIDGVWERDFVLVPWSTGSPRWVVEVGWGDDVRAIEVAGPQVQAAGAWALQPERRPRADEGSVVPEATPPPVSRDLAAVTPGFPDERVRSPPLGAGRYPPGARWITGGWAETAHLDPWWPEIVPELLAYDGAVEDPSGQIRVEAGATPNEVFIGQQVSLFATVSLDPAAISRMGRNPEYRPPEWSGFSRVDEVFGAAAFPSAGQGDLDHSFSFLHAFFPQREGTWTLPAGQIVFGRIGIGAESIEGSPLRVDVKPIPAAGAPPGYRGAVGRYRIRGWVQPEVIRWGEFGVLRIEISGVGEVRRLHPPLIPRIWGGEVSPLADYAWVEVRDGVVGGVRVFEYRVIPLQGTEVVIDPVVFPYFDPYLGDFGLTATGELVMGVIPPA